VGVALAHEDTPAQERPRPAQDATDLQPPLRPASRAFGFRDLVDDRPEWRRLLVLTGDGRDDLPVNPTHHRNGHDRRWLWCGWQRR
jgi:hypothetical protein